MTAQDWIIAESERKFVDTFNLARRTPEDKLDWSPVEGTRSILSILQEITGSASWVPALLKARKFEFSPEAMAAMKAEMEGWTSLEACETACREKMEGMFAEIRAFPDGDLFEKMHLPFFGGRDVTFEEVMGIFLWNLNYHYGQIAYIQTAYGDHKMS